MDLQKWEEATVYEDISVDEIDQALETYHDARADYEAKKKISNEADAVAKEAKRKLIEILKRSGKKKWEVEGIGKATITTKMTVKVPRDLEEKKKMLMYMRSLGEEAYIQLVGVNYQTLNGFYNQQIESDPDFTLPGVDAPIAEENIQFRRSK